MKTYLFQWFQSVIPRDLIIHYKLACKKQNNHGIIFIGYLQNVVEAI